MSSAEVKVLSLKESDINACRGFLAQLSMLNQQASAVQWQLAKYGVKAYATIHYDDGSDTVYMGIALKFRKREDAEYFMACIEEASRRVEEEQKRLTGMK